VDEEDDEVVTASDNNDIEAKNVQLQAVASSNTQQRQFIEFAHSRV
jgi:hypothetical protein